MIKYFRFSYDYILYDLSWSNALLLSASIPSYKKSGEDSTPPETVSTKDAQAFFE